MKALIQQKCVDIRTENWRGNKKKTLFAMQYLNQALKAFEIL